MLRLWIFSKGVLLSYMDGGYILTKTSLFMILPERNKNY